MLQLTDVRKSYTTGDFTQVALDDVSIAFRDNEFVAILGPSGSGKTTMLNVVGGLDHYDSGNLIIDGVATEAYRDRDWDAYRNNRIGFVFQSYNLIPHQSVLTNVELALTLAGVSPSERRRRAQAALADVGLDDHAHKRPSQLSGGQMQRVAIARALINDPEILLADEPTGALDSQTSVQIMGLLTRIAQDRLVIMVTHNPDLASAYATRIVELRDGEVHSDSNPYTPETEAAAPQRPARRTSMSFLTAIALSFNNLMTKKGRTLMTSFAGSIGIIGIAAILALANGVGLYIKGVEEDTLSMYPLSIQRQGFDMGTMLAASAGVMRDARDPDSAPTGDVHEVHLLSTMFGGVGTNDLASLKTFFDGNGGGIADHVNAIEYTYDVTPRIFASDTADGPRQVNPDTAFNALGFSSTSPASSLMGGSDTSVFSQLVDDLSLVEEQYTPVAGRWPTSAFETVVVLTPSGGVSDLVLYAMGLRDPAELDEMVKQLANEERISTPGETLSFSYQDLMDVQFKLVDASNLYTHDTAFDVWTDRSSDEPFVTSLVEGGETLRVVGVVKPTGDSSVLRPGIHYTSALTRHVIEQAAQSEIVQRQLANRTVNVFSGTGFDDDQSNQLDLASLVTVDEDAIKEAFTFDQSKLKLDLSGLDGLSLPDLDLDLDPSQLPTLDLATVLSGLDLARLVRVPDLSGDAALLGGRAAALTEGYVTWAVASGLDPADTDTSFAAYLASPEGRALLLGLTNPTPSTPTPMPSPTTSPTEPAPTPTASPASSPSLTPSTPTGVPEPGLLTELVDGYLSHAIGSGQDVTAVAENFPSYLSSEAGQAWQAGAAGLIDTQALQTQLQSALTDYMGQVMQTYMGQVTEQISSALRTQITGALEGAMGQLAEKMPEAMGIDQEAFTAAFTLNKNQEELTQLLMSMASSQLNSYEGNLRTLGWADLADPSGVEIYPIDFESKTQVIAILDAYNQRATDAGNEDGFITYTDFVGALMGSVTDIINMISYVLVAFVAISLIVSSIMIGVITYISVLERKKEIGILRSIGASKRDIRRVFNAETLIVGLVAGLLGVVITVLLTIPTNLIVSANYGVDNIAQLPWLAALALVGISMALTSAAGLIPSSAASRKDPVEALRSD